MSQKMRVTLKQVRATLTLISMRKNDLQDFNLLPFGGFNTTTPTALQSIPPSAQKMAVITTRAIFHNLTLPARGKKYIKTFVNIRVHITITVGIKFVSQILFPACELIFAKMLNVFARHSLWQYVATLGVQVEKLPTL